MVTKKSQLDGSPPTPPCSSPAGHGEHDLHGVDGLGPPLWPCALRVSPTACPSRLQTRENQKFLRFSSPGHPKRPPLPQDLPSPRLGNNLPSQAGPKGFRLKKREWQSFAVFDLAPGSTNGGTVYV
ncbi:hypothetical protein GWK47_014973 [Chionoecetes opilio]|uniref:Uncharacterized protein n=1 Tax=Chionoecetes opilio TaxID=41210 RepID=A0A8J4XUB8_CHIOP|nr:hypothetical protein GWK47_014973 [Chionoecetes opilio]